MATKRRKTKSAKGAADKITPAYAGCLKVALKPDHYRNSPMILIRLAAGFGGTCLATAGTEEVDQRF